MSSGPKLQVKRLRPDAVTPCYATDGAAGLDLCACLDEPLWFGPGSVHAVPTGLAIALPPGHEGQVRPRSGLAAKRGITVLNAPGTIDEDYRGEVKVLLINLSHWPYMMQPGDRVAQLIVAPVSKVQIATVEALDDTARGGGGFGSTGR